MIRTFFEWLGLLAAAFFIAFVFSVATGIGLPEKPFRAPVNDTSANSLPAYTFET